MKLSNLSAIAALLLVTTLSLVVGLIFSRREPAANLWDHTMLTSGTPSGWYANLWLWWVLLAAILVGIYVKFW